MKGRSHRLPPSAPLEDWGDGQWTVDCSCGVTFDDGEEMVDCDECGVWVHTRCSRYVRGEASFSCHNCKASTKRSRTVVTTAATNFSHDTEETEVAQLLVELPTKTDRPPPIQPGNAPYRQPFRLWAHVPMEERVHVQGVPGGDPSLFRGLSSKILSPELWKCTGYVPKKFNFKYKEFPCWEEEERDKANLGADALFSLSKETVQAAPVKTFDKMLSPDGAKKKEGEKILSDTRSFGCVKKERNKLRVLRLSKSRKEESGEEKEFTGKRRSRGDFDRPSTHIKEKAGCVPRPESRKENLCEDGGLHIAESDVPETKNAYKKEDTIVKPSYKKTDEGMENGSKPKHMLVFKTSRRRLSEEASRSKLSLETQPRSKFLLETPMKVDKTDQLDGKVSCKLNTIAACREDNTITKVFIKQEDTVKLMPSFKEPKEENRDHTILNGGSTAAVIGLDAMNAGIHSHGSQPNAADISFGPSSALSSLSTKKVEINLKTEATDDQALQNTDLPRLFSGGKQSVVDDLPQIHPKTKDCLLIVPDELKTAVNVQNVEEKQQVLQKDLDLSQRNQECVNTTGGEPVLHDVMVDCPNSLTRWKGSVESNHISKMYSTVSMKLNGANPSHSAPVVQKVVGIGKEFPNSADLVGSKSPLCSNQNSMPNAASSFAIRKAFHMAKQHRVKVTNSSVGNHDTLKTSMSAENSELAVLPQTGQVFMGPKSLQTGKTSHVSASKNCSLDSKEQPSGPSCQGTENHLSSSEIATAIVPMVQSPSSQTRLTVSGTSQKNEKTPENTRPTSKFLSHSLVMQASTSGNTATTLSDEELALLLHQELNSSPRVPRVPRMRQTTNTQFATPNNTSMLSKRSYSGGRDQFSRGKHKEEVSKDSSRHSRDVAGETRRTGRHSPEPKKDESSVFSDGFAKRGKGSRPHDTMASLKTNVSGTSIEVANSFAPSREENGATRTSLQTLPANADGNATLAGCSLPFLIDEIMSKGKCSTYEELCDAVRPYWHGLRKPNGERYAYSSHSQAVLDCLRNRSEWAHLIDRGPKTNASKRRRKIDSDSPIMEFEPEKSGNPRREDFPKGKRNVRKRRLLERRLGGGKKEVKNARSHAALSDDYLTALSHSSNEETECHLSDGNEAEACSSSSDDSD